VSDTTWRADAMSAASLSGSWPPQPRCLLRMVSSTSRSALRWSCSAKLVRSTSTGYCTMLVTSVVLSQLE
jgi:hypothetical protein